MKITVYGKPITQGSKTRTRYGMRDDNASTLKPWREAVKTAAFEAMRGTIRHEGPMAVAVVFTFDKPKSAPKRTRTWPTTRGTGDLDKLQRACFDALTDAGVWRDDSQVISVIAVKCFVGEHPSALHIPGVAISVTPLEIGVA